MLHDTLQQCYANAVILALPVMLPCFNKAEHFHPVEILGVVMWCSCWAWENAADFAMHKFKAKVKEDGVKDAVLGYAPYDTSEFRIWTVCRHPNYFGEWMSWNSIIVSSIPSLYHLFVNKGEELWILIGFVIT